MKRSLKFVSAWAFSWLNVVAAITCMTAYNLLQLGGLKLAPLALGIEGGDPPDGGTATIDQQLSRTLDSINKRLGKVDGLEEAIAKNKTDYDAVTKVIEEVKADMLTVRKLQLQLKTQAPRRKGTVSDDCAAFLGALYLKAGIMQEKFAGRSLDFARTEVENILGKTALSSSDIPLPVGYSGEVVELVSQWGFARQFGTVFPLGNGVVKLPRLKTDPVFGLIAQSATVTEKSPQTEWVTFTAEKFGGLVRLPSELDEDSIVAMGQFLARYGARNMARCEDYQFFASTGAGSGVNGSVEGLLATVGTNSKLVSLATDDLAISDVTLAKVREMRSLVDAPVLGMGAYYFHPTLEQKFAAFNTAGDKPYIANGVQGASLDGFPIRWVDSLPAYSTSDSAEETFGLFGDVSYHYLAPRGGMRADTSREAGFTTDEILVRFLERFTTGNMATGAVSGIATGASS